MHKTSLKQKLFLISLGVFLSLILLEGILRLGGFLLTSRQESRNKSSTKTNNSYNILCLGESTTAAGAKNSYPRQLEAILNEKRIGIQFIIINAGKMGVDTNYIISNLEDNINKYNPDIVITMMGINDTEETVEHKTSSFYRSLRTYKLLKLLALHIASKMKMTSFYPDKETLSKKSLKEIDAAKETLRQMRDPEQKNNIIDKDLINSAFMKLGNHYTESMNHKKSEKVFKEAILFDTNNTWAYEGLAKFYLNNKQYEKAEEYFKLIIKRTKKNEEIYGILTNLRLKR